VTPIDQYGVPLLISLSLCVPLTRASLHLFYYKKGERVKVRTWVGVHLDHLVSETTKEDILYELSSRSKKTGKSRNKNEKAKEIKRGFYRSDIVCNLLIE
jgi:hypothetical protein